MRDSKKVYQMAGTLNTNMSYAVVANSDRLKKHKHAWKVWHALKDFGCKVYPVAEGLTRFEGSKVYPDLISLQGKVDVVIPCLRAELLEDIVEKSAEIEAGFIWFQEKNWTPEFDAQCSEKRIEVIRGCVLKHIIYPKPLSFLNPCYWHGWQENKVPGKYQRMK